MKIMDNGKVRDMTPEEEEEFMRWHENVPPPGSEEYEAPAEDYEQALADLGVRV